MSVTVQAIITELRRQLEVLYGPRLVWMMLYGSQARGNAEPGSDIDVLVVLQGPVSLGQEIARTSDIIAALSFQYGVVLSRTFVYDSRSSGLAQKNPLQSSCGQTLGQ